MACAVAGESEGSCCCKLADFGLARTLDGRRGGEEREGQAPTGAGTLGYAAPELLTGSSNSKPTDMYAFGVGHTPLQSSPRSMQYYYMQHSPLAPQQTSCRCICVVALLITRPSRSAVTMRTVVVHLRAGLLVGDVHSSALGTSPASPPSSNQRSGSSRPRGRGVHRDRLLGHTRRRG